MIHSSSFLQEAEQCVMHKIETALPIGFWVYFPSNQSPLFPIGGDLLSLMDGV